MERFNKKVVGMVIEGIEENREQLMECYDDAISNLKCADTINDVMKAKQELMWDIVDTIPIKYDTCYFCLYFQNMGLGHKEACERCSYGVAHGICCKIVSGKTSDWSRMHKLVIDLIDYINEKYWTGGEISAKHKGHKTNTS